MARWLCDVFSIGNDNNETAEYSIMLKSEQSILRRLLTPVTICNSCGECGSVTSKCLGHTYRCELYWVFSLVSEIKDCKIRP